MSPRRARGAPARAPAADRAPRLRERAAVHARSSTRPACTPTTSARSTDVAKLPFTTKDDLRADLPVRHVRRADGAGRPHPRLVAARPGARPSSATRRATSSNWATLIARSLRASGIRPGMKVHNAYGYGLFTGGLGAHAGIEELGATVIPMSGGQTARQVQLIRDFEPDAILCTPSYLLTIADAMADAGHRPALHEPARSACSAPSRGRTRCAASSSSASASTRSTSTGSAR